MRKITEDTYSDMVYWTNNWVRQSKNRYLKAKIEHLLSLTRLKARGIFLSSAISRLSTQHVKLDVTSFICSFGLVAPDLSALAFDCWALTIKAISLAIVAIDQVLDIKVSGTFTRGSRT